MQPLIYWTVVKWILGTMEHVIKEAEKLLNNNERVFLQLCVTFKKLLARKCQCLEPLDDTQRCDWFQRCLRLRGLMRQTVAKKKLTWCRASRWRWRWRARRWRSLRSCPTCRRRSRRDPSWQRWAPETRTRALTFKDNSSSYPRSNRGS